VRREWFFNRRVGLIVAPDSDAVCARLVPQFPNSTAYAANAFIGFSVVDFRIGGSTYFILSVLKRNAATDPRAGFPPESPPRGASRVPTTAGRPSHKVYAVTKGTKRAAPAPCPSVATIEQCAPFIVPAGLHPL
jgi:hypothetical protein